MNSLQQKQKQDQQDDQYQIVFQEQQGFSKIALPGTTFQNVIQHKRHDEQGRNAQSR